MSRRFSVTVAGTKRVFVVCNDSAICGFMSCPETDYGGDPWADEPKRQINVANWLRGQRELDTFVHETIHAAAPDLSESVVSCIGSTVAEVLWKAGYRRGGRAER